MSGCLKNLTFALELGLAVPFKKKQEINNLINNNGGRVTYMINRKVLPPVTFRASFPRHPSPTAQAHIFFVLLLPT
jgi:hypothetical protein